MDIKFIRFDQEKYEAIKQRMASVMSIGLVLKERERQNEKWGEQNHDDSTWHLILCEEVGELAEAILHDKFGGHAAGTMKAELVQVAAVAVQWLEATERREAAVCRWSWDRGGGYWETSCVSEKYFTGKKEDVKSCHSCGRPVEWVTAVSEEV